MQKREEAVEFQVRNSKNAEEALSTELWTIEGTKIENPSFNMYASARSIAKLGAFMANKGQFEEKQLFSEDIW